MIFLFFFFEKAMVPSLRYLIIIEKLYRVYHGNIIYPFRIYPNRFIYLCQGWGGGSGWLGHNVAVFLNV